MYYSYINTIIVCARLFVHYPELFGDSVCISYIGRSANAWVRCPLDRGVCYLESSL